MGRYTKEIVSAEVRRVMSHWRDEHGRAVPQKALADVLGITPGQLSRKMTLSDRRSQFNTLDCGLLADFFDAPPGWPYIPWDTGNRPMKRRIR